MKKKQLQAIKSIEKWLLQNDAVTEEVSSAMEVIKNSISSITEVQKEVSSELPLPAEISEEPMTLALYSDGGCRGNPGPGAYAYVIQEHDGKVLAEGAEFEVLTTNNRMELSGALWGLQGLAELLPSQGKDPLLTKVKVITDSKYVVDGMKSWVSGWKARGWKKADNKAPENLELWQGLDSVRSRFMEVEWSWVRGHAGHPQNEYCDRKANELMDKHQS